jgi:hypothetical protein
VTVSATLSYTVTATGPVSPAALEAAMTAVVLDPSGIEQATGAVLSTDTTSLVGSTAERTLVFNIAGAEFQTRFPPGTDQSCPFIGLYKQALSGALNSFVVENPVILA